MQNNCILQSVNIKKNRSINVNAECTKEILKPLIIAKNHYQCNPKYVYL